ncbi:MAG TPA: helix-turn-helix domain-containing protein [Cytophagales bacterium]
MDTTELSALVRFHRKRAGLSGNELADLAGVGKNAVYAVEQGKMTVQWDTLLKILGALNVQVRFRSPLMEEFESQFHAKS